MKSGFQELSQKYRGDSVRFSVRSLKKKTKVKNKKPTKDVHSFLPCVLFPIVEGDVTFWYQSQALDLLGIIIIIIIIVIMKG